MIETKQIIPDKNLLRKSNFPLNKGHGSNIVIQLGKNSKNSKDFKQSNATMIVKQDKNINGPNMNSDDVGHGMHILSMSNSVVATPVSKVEIASGDNMGRDNIDVEGDGPTATVRATISDDDAGLSERVVTSKGINVDTARFGSSIDDSQTSRSRNKTNSMFEGHNAYCD